MKRELLFAGVLLVLLPTSALAAPKPPIAITALAPTVSTNFSAGDQVSAMALANGAIYLAGTIETTSSKLITSNPLGASDGFLIALGSNGSKLWDLRLGGVGDDVATAICVDLIGNIWVAGASAISTTTPAPGLNRLTVWEVSSTGVLENTYVKDTPDVNIPTSIAAKGANFTLQGVTSKTGSSSFAATLNPAGNIGSLNFSSTKLPVAPLTRSVNSSAYSWQSFITNGPLKGVTGIALHQITTVLTRSGLKDKSLKGVNSVTGTPLSLQYQSGTGVVLLTQGSGTYFLTIIHTK